MRLWIKYNGLMFLPLTMGLNVISICVRRVQCAAQLYTKVFVVLIVWYKESVLYLSIIELYIAKVNISFYIIWF